MEIYVQYLCGDLYILYNILINNQSKNRLTLVGIRGIIKIAYRKGGIEKYEVAENNSIYNNWIDNANNFYVFCTDK